MNLRRLCHLPCAGAAGGDSAGVVDGDGAGLEGIGGLWTDSAGVGPTGVFLAAILSVFGSSGRSVDGGGTFGSFSFSGGRSPVPRLPIDSSGVLVLGPVACQGGGFVFFGVTGGHQPVLPVVRLFFPVKQGQ